MRFLKNYVFALFNKVITKIKSSFKNLIHRIRNWWRWKGKDQAKQLVANLKNFLLQINTLGFVLLILSCSLMFWGHITYQKLGDFTALFEELWANFSAEVGSIAITVLIVDRLYRNQSNKVAEEQEQARRLTQQQLYEFKMYDPDTAPQERGQLIYEMHLLGILEGATLSRLDFSGVKFGKILPGTSINPAYSLPNHEKPQTISLKGVNFGECDLTDADFTGVNMQRTFFNLATITRTKFDFADLRGASFGMYTQLKDVSFREANLEGIEFSRIEISGIDCTGANIKGVHFYRYGPGKMILPNGQPLRFKEDLEEFEFRVTTMGEFPSRDDVTAEG